MLSRSVREIIAALADAADDVGEKSTADVVDIGLAGSKSAAKNALLTVIAISENPRLVRLADDAISAIEAAEGPATSAYKNTFDSAPMRFISHWVDHAREQNIGKIPGRVLSDAIRMLQERAEAFRAEGTKKGFDIKLPVMQVGDFVSVADLEDWLARFRQVVSEDAAFAIDAALVEPEKPRESTPGTPEVPTPVVQPPPVSEPPPAPPVPVAQPKPQGIGLGKPTTNIPKITGPVGLGPRPKMKI